MAGRELWWVSAALAASASSTSEQVYPVPPLSLEGPVGADADGPGDAGSPDAVTLFFDRAAAAAGPAR